jgi:hypothetical protein
MAEILPQTLNGLFTILKQDGHNRALASAIRRIRARSKEETDEDMVYRGHEPSDLAQYLWSDEEHGEGILDALRRIPRPEPGDGDLITYLEETQRKMKEIMASIAGQKAHTGAELVAMIEKVTPEGAEALRFFFGANHRDLNAALLAEDTELFAEDFENDSLREKDEAALLAAMMFRLLT